MSDHHDRETTAPTRLGALRVRTMGSGAPAALWHSLFVDSSTWARVEEGLACHRRLLIIDGPCHGASAPTTDRFTLDDCAGAACDVLDHLDARGPVDWVGNAWGGHVGVIFAATKPDRCRSLVTVGTPISALTPGERRQIVALLPVYRLLGPIRPIVGAITEALLGPGSDPRDARLVGDAFRRAGRSGMYNAIRSASLNRPDLTSTLATVNAPTLIVAGDRDKAWPPAEARAASQRPRQGAHRTVTGAGHVAPLLQAAPSLIELISDFWTDPVAATHRVRSIGPS